MRRDENRNPAAKAVRRAGAFPWVGLALAALALGLGAGLFVYTVDDAFIVGRYAQRLADGRGYGFVDGPPTDGVTAPIWLVPGVLGAALGADPVQAAKLTGLACAALSVLVLHGAARRRAIGALGAGVACGFLVLAPSFLAWSVAGLEASAAALACTVLAAAALNAPRPLRAGLAAALLVLLRPECAPVALALAGHLARRIGRPAAPALALPGAALAALAGARWLAFGTLTPLSAAAKPPDLAHGIEYAIRVLGYGTALVALPAAVAAARGSRRMRVLLGAVGVHLAAIVLAGGDWMPGVRLFVPVLPLLAWMVGVGVSDLVRRTRSRAALVAACCVVLGAPGLLFVLDARQAIDAGRTREREGRALARELTAAAHRVALIDVGFLAYVGGFEPVDLAGVTDPRIGRLPGGHCDKPVTGAMLIERGVDGLLLHASSEPRADAEGRLVALAGHPVERRLAMDETVRRAFRVTEIRRYAEGYWYVLLRPRVAEALPLH